MEGTSEFSYNPNKRKRPYEKPLTNPWQRKERPLLLGSKMLLNSFNERFDTFILANNGLDLDTKRAALRISRSVVSIISFKDEQVLFKGSGTIINCVAAPGNSYQSTILTSATLLRHTEIQVTHAIKILVYLCDGQLYDGQVFASDAHFNIASIKISSTSPLPTAELINLDDSIPFKPSSVWRFEQQRKPWSSFKISPGDMVIALGRYHEPPFDLMGASGRFSVASCYFDCGELFRADCKISKVGTGGPLINRYGEVIGLNYYEELYTPFLPSNIISKCLEQFEKYGRVCRPWLGLELTNLYTATLDKMEKVFLKFPNIYTCVLVEEVIPESPAELAGILSGDLIYQCNGKIVQSFLEFFSIILDNVGDSVEMIILREAKGEKCNKTLKVDEISTDNINRWPISENRWTITRYR